MSHRGLEERLKRMRRVPAPTSLDRRMKALFDEAGRDGETRRPWRLPAWAAAAVGLVLVASFLIRGEFGPKPLVVEITPDSGLEQFLLGDEPAVTTGGLEILTRGDCAVETVWPADAPGLDRRPINSSFIKGDRK